MFSFTIVTGNARKLTELRRLLPAHVSFDSADIDLDEIQTIDHKELIEDKARRAYEILQKPVLVEDVGAGLVALGGLPGPFIKFFEIQLGEDALNKLVKDDPRAVVTCAICYYDGTQSIVAQAEVTGTAVANTVSNKFGFDCVFIPDGHTKTFAEMTPDEKDACSHRALAMRELAKHPLFAEPTA